MKNKSKVENLNNSISLFIGVRSMLADNVKDLDEFSDSIDELYNDIERLERLNTPEYQLNQLKQKYDIKARTYNQLFDAHQHNLITLWKLSRYILKQFKHFSEDEIKEYKLNDIQESIQEQSDNIKPKFIDLVKYDIKHIKD
jgi:DNA mismatch repair ATPase MutS